MREVYVIILGAMLFAACGDDPTSKRDITLWAPPYNIQGLATVIASHGVVHSGGVGIAGVVTEQYERYQSLKAHATTWVTRLR